jgi:hypothetical protein
MAVLRETHDPMRISRISACEPEDLFIVNSYRIDASPAD